MDYFLKITTMAAIGESGKLSAGVPDSITNVRSRTTSSRRHNHRGVRPLVYVTRRIPQVGVDILLKTCDVKQWDSELAVPKGELLYSVVGADAILCMQGDNIDFNVLNAAGKVAFNFELKSMKHDGKRNENLFLFKTI